MQSRLLFLAAGAAALGACAPDTPLAPLTRPAAATASVADQAPGQQIVTFKAQDQVPADLEARVAQLGGRVEYTAPGIGMAVVSGLSPDAIAQLAAQRDVYRVQPDESFTLDDVASGEEATASAAPTDAVAALPSSAYFFARQWDYRVIGADRAWAAGQLGSSAVKVAILDTGIDSSYFDLRGLVDAAGSTSFIPGDAAVLAGMFPGDAAAPWIDLNGHGTHVASTVSSRGAVIAGMTQRTTLMAVKVLSARGSGSTAGVIAGIAWAADHGADVINMSLGSGFFKSVYRGYVSVFNRATSYARRAGTTIVVAAGNDAIDLDHAGNYYADWCQTPNVVCVAATGPLGNPNYPAAPTMALDEHAVYSNFGRSAIDVAAPGGNFRPDYDVQHPAPADFAWIYQACSRYSLSYDTKTSTYSKTVCSTPIGRRSVYITGYIGTSQATPHVAGLAALIIAQRGRIGPAQVRATIEQSAGDLGQPGTDPYYGKGRIDVMKALGL